MTLSAFDDKSREPTKGELAEVLGQAAGLWDQLISSIRSRFDPLAEDWGFSGKKWGWALCLKHKKRAVLYMTPSDGFFYVGFALGQKAVDVAHASNLPSSVLDVIDNSQKYAEGRGVRLEVRCSDDVRSVVQLADIKMES
jgi:hypothetical protein